MNINFNQTKFLLSVAEIKQLPEDNCREITFAGSSNSGKSSAINTITGIKNLAKTSKTPGRTQLINYFTIQDNLYLVDLPGYGYAKVPAKIKKNWDNLLEKYFETRESIYGVVITSDIRHALKPFDLKMINFATEKNIPVHILLTKSDKLKRGAQNIILLNIKKQLDNYKDLVTWQLFSSHNFQGLEQARETVAKIISE